MHAQANATDQRTSCSRKRQRNPTAEPAGRGGGGGGGGRPRGRPPCSPAVMGGSTACPQLVVRAVVCLRRSQTARTRPLWRQFLRNGVTATFRQRSPPRSGGLPAPLCSATLPVGAQHFLPVRTCPTAQTCDPWSIGDQAFSQLVGHQSEQHVITVHDGDADHVRISREEWGRALFGLSQRPDQSLSGYVFFA